MEEASDKLQPAKYHAGGGQGDARTVDDRLTSIPDLPAFFSEPEERVTRPHSLLAKSGKLELNQVRYSDTNRERGTSDLSSRRRWAALADKFAARRPPR